MIGSEERRTLTADTADIVRFLVGDPGMEGLKSWTGRCLGVVYTSGRCKMEIEVVAGIEYDGLGRCCVIVKFFLETVEFPKVKVLWYPFPWKMAA